jgi:hypothetical protein
MCVLLARDGSGGVSSHMFSSYLINEVVGCHAAQLHPFSTRESESPNPSKLHII